MVFDLDSKESFLNLPKWEKILKENGIDFKKSTVFLVGNKTDLKPKVDIKGSFLTVSRRLTQLKSQNSQNKETLISTSLQPITETMWPK